MGFRIRRGCLSQVARDHANKGGLALKSFCVLPKSRSEGEGSYGPFIRVISQKRPDRNMSLTSVSGTDLSENGWL